MNKIGYWRNNPVDFVRENFQVEPDAWQADALHLAVKPGARKRIAMKACTGPGKSAVLAWIGWIRLSCYGEKGNHPKGASLSGEGRDNLRDNLWAELAKWQQRSKFLSECFTWTKEQIYANDHPETWFLSARSYPKDADQDAMGRSLSGLHSKYPFVLLDETGAMPVGVGQKSEQIFTGGCVDGLVMQAGNPTSTSGLLYHQCVRAADQTDVITITADPDDPKRTPRVDIDHAKEMIQKYGRDNPWVMSTILGLFPPGGLNSLLSVDEVEQAMRRKPDPSHSFAQKRLGIDVARFGDDRTVIFPRQGLMTFKPVEMRGARSDEIAARVALAKQKWDSDIEMVDGSGGYGSGVVDALIRAGHSPFEISFSGKAIDNRYYNKRAEMWFNMAEWVKRGGCLPQIPALINELTSPTYTFTNGKFMIEPKEHIKDRIGSSPDLADALCLTFAVPEMPAKSEIEQYRDVFQASKVKHDFDPLRDA